MSLLTRCPACRTMFKVVPDQLRISEGWVRCGQCDEVFDAREHLQETLPEPAGETASSPIELDFDLPDEATLPASAAPSADEARPLTSEPPTPESVLDDPDSMPFLPTVQVDETAFAAAAGESLPDGMAATSPSFLRGVSASGAAPSRSRSVWRLAAIFLILALLVQWVAQERDRLVAQAPGLKPVVETVCVLMQCRIAPLRQIESVQIDSASFNKVRPDVYRLNLTLKNVSGADVALPAIELSLTDVQDQPLMRRVFLANELGLSSPVLAARSEATISLPLGITKGEPAERIAGYHVLAFYP